MNPLVINDTMSNSSQKSVSSRKDKSQLNKLGKYLYKQVLKGFK